MNYLIKIEFGKSKRKLGSGKYMENGSLGRKYESKDENLKGKNYLKDLEIWGLFKKTIFQQNYLWTMNVRDQLRKTEWGLTNLEIWHHKKRRQLEELYIIWFSRELISKITGIRSGW